MKPGPGLKNSTDQKPSEIPFNRPKNLVKVQQTAYIDHLVILTDESVSVKVNRGARYYDNGNIWCHDRELVNILPHGRHNICLCNIKKLALVKSREFINIKPITSLWKEKKIVTLRSVTDEYNPQSRGVLLIVSNKRTVSSLKFLCHNALPTAQVYMAQRTNNAIFKDSAYLNGVKFDLRCYNNQEIISTCACDRWT